MRIFSHRGVSTPYRENSLRAFRTVLQAGFSLETDIRQTADGKFVISHDSDLERSVGSDREISQTTLEGLRNLSSPAGRDDEKPAIPTLSEVIDLFLTVAADNAHLALHLKELQRAESERLLAERLSAINGAFDINIFERLFVFGVGIDSAGRLRDHSSALRIGFIIGEDDQFPTATHPTVYGYSDVEHLEWWDVVWAAEWYGRLYSPAFVERCQQDGRDVICVSTELHTETTPPHPAPGAYRAVWDDLLTYGVDGICTDYPTELRAASREQGAATED